MSGRPRRAAQWRPLPLGCTVCRAEGRAVARHSHRSHVATVAAAGAREILFGSASVTLAPGAVLLIPAGMGHATAAGGLAVSLSMPRACLPGLTQAEIVADPALAEAVAALASTPVSLARLDAVMAALRRRTVGRMVPAGLRLPPTAERMQAQVRDGCRRIGDGVPLADAAVEAGFYDQSQMTRQFLRVLGMTPGDYRSGWPAARRAEPGPDRR